MAEEEGFEPPRRFPALIAFEAIPFSRTWVFLHDGGGKGIRTLAPVSRPTRFPSEPLQPLGYSSVAKLIIGLNPLKVNAGRIYFSA